MDVIKWQLNFGSCNFGPKSYLWFQIKLALPAPLILKSRVWFQTKLHSTQFNYHYKQLHRGRFFSIFKGTEVKEVNVIDVLFEKWNLSGVKNKFKPHRQNKILVPLRVFFKISDKYPPVLLIWKSPPRGGKPSGSMVLSNPKVKSLNIVRVLVVLLVQFGKVPLFAQVRMKMLADSLNFRCLLELHTLSFQEFVTQGDGWRSGSLIVLNLLWATYI